eukprot:CAMPEP_0115245858 /NCGR_PEP_ID=MMETSP0270-20121206/40722_1 /TAXON_ID=71861 /ORGANISM="Scrippsiella trochoidea, Strain CCMP3099" /LENGTH=152 /DNA_ID=CAMNT_0002661043 /DNA_START=390 /DNA_END=847 /DNA_ORIENTATION=+
MTQAPTKQCPEGVGPRMSFISRFSCNCRGDGMLHLGLDPERLQASCWKASTSLTYASASCSPSRQTRSTHHGTGKSEAAGDLSPRTFALGSERAFLQVACALSMALSFAAAGCKKCRELCSGTMASFVLEIVGRAEVSSSTAIDDIAALPAR